MLGMWISLHTFTNYLVIAIMVSGIIEVETSMHTVLTTKTVWIRLGSAVD